MVFLDNEKDQSWNFLIHGFFLTGKQTCNPIYVGHTPLPSSDNTRLAEQPGWFPISPSALDSSVEVSYLAALAGELWQTVTRK